MNKYRLPLAAVVVWVVLLIVEVGAGLKMPYGASDSLSTAMAGLSQSLAPVRAALMHATATLPGVGGQLVAGLTIGDTSRVSESLDVAMKQASLTHLVAVSGANCQIVTAVCFALLSALGLPRWMRIAGSVVALTIFVALVTPGPSVTRAAVMSVAVLVGLAVGRLSSGLPTLALATIVLLCLEPMWAIDFGFALSVLASAGLLVLTRPITSFLQRWLPRWIALVIAVPVAAATLCQPVIVLLSPSLPTYGVLANLLSVPAAGFATVAGLIVCALSMLWVPAGAVAAWIAWLPAEWIGQVAVVTSSWPFARLPWPSGVAGVAAAAAVSALAVVVVTHRRKRWRRAAALLASAGIGCSLVVAIGSSAHAAVAVPGDWSIAACDVGQGDAVLIRAADAEGVAHLGLIDTGRRPDLVRECLRRMNISHLDLLVLTHYDLDHVGGASAVTGIVDSALVGEPENAQDRRLGAELRAGGAKVERGLQGMSGVLGSATWSVLWPDGRTPNMQVGNPGSITLIVRWTSFSVPFSAAFLGDLGAQAQDALLNSVVDVGSVDVLKVAHHGSADTSQAMTNRLHPRVALISVGADNGYGHPTKKALTMLEGEGTLVGRTDRQGMLFVCVRGSDLVLFSDR